MELLRFLEITDRQSFRQWALRNHPDKGGDNGKFVEVKEAFERLHGADGKVAAAPAPAPARSATDLNKKYADAFNRASAQNFFAERAPPPDAQRCTGWLASRGRRCFKLRAKKGGDLCDVHAAKAAKEG